MSAATKRLPLTTLELWKRKAVALDEALALLDGQIDTDLEMEVYQILKRACQES